ncbi:AT-hook motif nuclear-localized protein 1-like isoform X2 [Cicer arietinum]|uniref:AT-hook motif nuclear-localized protein 1-like isoform X2 n=1 Tax=Cicer arietinum TaxID=3827 RepID=UPI003CC64497
MEDQNLNLPVALSPCSTQNGSETTNNAAVTEAAGVDAGSDTGAKSEGGGSGLQGVKRGRGRPRKYEVDVNQISPAPLSPSPVGIAMQPFGSDSKRGRGRPRGSGKLQILASIETAGGSITPHVVTVNPGEDVVGKIFSFFQKGPRAAVCILSATGTVSSVILRQPGASDGCLRYEGRFEILTLSGSCTYTSGAGGAQRKVAMLSVSLAKPDGRVFGGGVENSLIAATPIQLVLATFKQNISNQIKRKYSSSQTPTTPDSTRDNLKVPKLTIEGDIEGDNNVTNTNDVTVADNNVKVETTIDNVTTIVVGDENVQSDYVGGGIDLDNKALEFVTTDHKTCSDVDANSVPQI